MIVIKCRLHRNRDKYYKFFCWGGGGCEARSGIQLNVKSVKIYRGTENLGLNRYFNSINTTCATLRNVIFHYFFSRYAVIKRIKACTNETFHSLHSVNHLVRYQPTEKIVNLVKLRIVETKKEMVGKA